MPCQLGHANFLSVEISSMSQVCLSFYKGNLVICLNNAYLRASLRHFDRYYVGILTLQINLFPNSIYLGLFTV